MKTKTIGVGLLLVGAGALAEDARSWAVGELLNAIKPAGGWNLAGIVSMPWGSIIGVPVFLIAALWLLWDAFGRASFRARFGAERVLAEHVAPLKARFEFNYAHIQNIYTALGALRDRERLKESREKLEITERSIWQLTALPEINDSLAFTLTSFEAEWTDELNYWVSIAQAYDEGIGTRINTLSEEQRKEPLPFNAEGLGSGPIDVSVAI
ncbi:hypothetical protein [Sphingomonas molluscorum]|uniref:hypothetical protein n=1 Tax=Sphingomonas molluscorum TaxID=418184 RepID=UPI0031D6A25D